MRGFRFALSVATVLGAFFAAGGARAADTPAAVRVAIVAAPELRALADLLTADLSARPEVALLERSDIDRVLREQELVAASLADAKAFSLGKLLGANALILLRTEARPDKKQAARCKIVAVGPGVILDSFGTPWPAKDERAWVGSVGDALARQLDKLRVPPERALLLSVPKMKSSFRTAVTRDLESSFHSVLIERLLHEPDVFVVERQEISTVVAEKNMEIADATALRAGRILVAGMIEESPSPNEPVSVLVQVTVPPKTEPAVVKASGRADDVAALADATARGILKIMDRAPQAKTWDPAAEAEYYERRARWLHGCGQAADGLAAADAAGALGRKSPELSLLYLALAAVRLEEANMPAHITIHKADYPDEAVLAMLQADADLVPRIVAHLQFLQRLGLPPDNPDYRTARSNLSIEGPSVLTKTLDQTFFLWHSYLTGNEACREAFARAVAGWRDLAEPPGGGAPAAASPARIEHLHLWYPDPAQAADLLAAACFPPDRKPTAIRSGNNPRYTLLRYLDTTLPCRELSPWKDVGGEPYTEYRQKLAATLDRLEGAARRPGDRAFWLVLRLESRERSDQERLFPEAWAELRSLRANLKEDAEWEDHFYAFGLALFLLPREGLRGYLAEADELLWQQRDRIGRSANWEECAMRLLNMRRGADEKLNERFIRHLLLHSAAPEYRLTNLPLKNASDARRQLALLREGLARADLGASCRRQLEGYQRIVEGMYPESRAEAAANAPAGPGAGPAPGPGAADTRLLVPEFWCPAGLNLDRGRPVDAELSTEAVWRDGAIWTHLWCEFGTTNYQGDRAIGNDQNYLLRMDGRSGQVDCFPAPRPFDSTVRGTFGFSGLEAGAGKAFVFYGTKFSSLSTTPRNRQVSGMVAFACAAGTWRTDPSIHASGRPVLAAGALFVPVFLGGSGQDASGLLAIDPQTLEKQLLASSLRSPPLTPLDVPCRRFEIRSLDREDRLGICALDAKDAVLTSAVYEARSGKWTAGGPVSEPGANLLDPMNPGLAPSSLARDIVAWSCTADPAGGVRLTLARRPPDPPMEIPVALALPAAEVAGIQEVFAVKWAVYPPVRHEIQFRPLPGRKELVEMLGIRVSPHLAPFGLWIPVTTEFAAPGFFIVPAKDIEDYLARNYGYRPRPGAGQPATAGAEGGGFRVRGSGRSDR